MKSKRKETKKKNNEEQSKRHSERQLFTFNMIQKSHLDTVRRGRGVGGARRRRRTHSGGNQGPIYGRRSGTKKLAQKFFPGNCFALGANDVSEYCYVSCASFFGARVFDSFCCVCVLCLKQQYVCDDVVLVCLHIDLSQARMFFVVGIFAINHIRLRFRFRSYRAVAFGVARNRLDFRARSF